MTNENSTPTIEYSDDLSDAVYTASQTLDRVRRLMEDPNTTPKKLRQVLSMLKFANDNVETELKDSIPVNKRNATTA